MKGFTLVFLLGLSTLLGYGQSEIDMAIFKGDFQQALVLLDRELETRTDANLFYKKGLVLEQLQRYEAAIPQFYQACELSPASTDYWVELSEAHAALGNYLNAISYLQQALSLEPANLRVKGKLAQCYINLKAYPDAYRCYEEIWQSDSTNAYYNRYFAYAAYRIGNDEKAIELYEHLADLGSQDLSTWLNLATIYTKKQKLNEAVSTCERALNLFPENPNLVLRMADSYFSAKSYQKALPVYERYLATNDSTFEVKKNYGICLYFDKQEEKAKEILEQCYYENGGDPIVHFYIGMCCKKLKQFDEAVDFYRLAIEASTPGYLAEIYHHQGQVYSQLRKFKEAIECYEEAMAIDPSKKELLFEIATTYEEFNANKAIALHYYREYAKAVRDEGVNINYALSRITKIKEELFFDEAQETSSK